MTIPATSSVSRDCGTGTHLNPLSKILDPPLHFLPTGISLNFPQHRLWHLQCSDAGSHKVQNMPKTTLPSDGKGHYQ